MKRILNMIFAARGAAIPSMTDSNACAAFSFPAGYDALHVEDRRNIVARYAGNAAKGNAAQATSALRTLKVVLSRPDPDPLVRWNIALAAIETAEKFPELRRTAHNVLRLITETPTPGDEPELIHLIARARETAPVPPPPKPYK